MPKFNFSKPLVVLLTGALLWVALSMVETKVTERQQFRYQAEQSVASSWTNSQTLVGPILVVPYEKSYQEKIWNKELKMYEKIDRKISKTLYILPQEADFVINLYSETRTRGIYPVPVYLAKISVTGQFFSNKLKILLNDPQNQQKGPAVLSFGVSDSRGIVSLPQITLNKSKIAPLSGSQLPFSPQGFSVEVSNPLMGEKTIEFQANFELNGMTAIDFLAIAKNQQIDLTSDWPHPMFRGSFLPLNYTVNDKGYHAQWKTSQYSVDFESIIDDCFDNICSELFANSFGVKQINSVDIYHQSQRAVAYGILFILATFIAFALVEVLQGIRLHPVQYGLAGANLSIFFLLLLALSEHLGFAIAYLLACCAILSLLYYYLLHSFKNSLVATFVTAGIGTLYGILYLIIQSEDHALLAGSVLLFGLLSSVIIATLKINWYRF